MSAPPDPTTRLALSVDSLIDTIANRIDDRFTAFEAEYDARTERWFARLDRIMELAKQLAASGDRVVTEDDGEVQ